MPITKLLQHDPKHHGWFISAPTMTQALHGALRGLLIHPRPDAVLNIESHAFNVTIHANSCSLELDVGKNLWLNKQRWSRLIKEYVPYADLHRFLDQCNEIFTGTARDGATANMLFRDPVRAEKKHRWGGCLMGATFRGAQDNNLKPTLTFFSRTSYIGYIGFLDAAIAHVMAQYITGHLSHIAFRWHLSSMQLHCFKTLPFIFSQLDLMKQLEAYRYNPQKSMPPTWKNIVKWYQKVLDAYRQYGTDMLDHEKYGPFKRIKRRWMEHMGYLNKNVPPSLPCSLLDFDKAI